MVTCRGWYIGLDEIAPRREERNRQLVKTMIVGVPRRCRALVAPSMELGEPQWQRSSPSEPC